MGAYLALTDGQKLIIAVIVLGFTVVFCHWFLTRWDRPGKDRTIGKNSRRRLMEEIRRHE